MACQEQIWHRTDGGNEHLCLTLAPLEGVKGFTLMKRRQGMESFREKKKREKNGPKITEKQGDRMNECRLLVEYLITRLW